MNLIVAYISGEVSKAIQAGRQKAGITQKDLATVLSFPNIN
jgi:ribosome-binding protein aMBF1 (putative translation factor)